MNICDKCASIRSMRISAMQSKCNCDLCGVLSMCSTMKLAELKGSADAFSEKGYFNSKDLAQLLILIKSRKAIIAPRIKDLQTELSYNKNVNEMANDMEDVAALLTAAGATKTITRTHAFIKKAMLIVGPWLEFDSTTAIKKTIVQNLVAELMGLTEKEKEMSILYKATLDQILIGQLRFRLGEAAFNKAYEESKKLYNQRNKKGA